MTSGRFVWDRRRFLLASSSLVAASLAGCASLLRNRSQSPHPISSGEPELDSRLYLLFDTLIPVGRGMPSGSEAGVGVYLQKFLAHLAADVRAARQNQHTLLLQTLSTLGFFVANAPLATREAILNDIAAKKTDDPVRAAYKTLKDDTISGYFADASIWKEGHGVEVWERLRVSPIYPLNSRADVRSRNMRAQSRAEVTLHLVAPSDRLPEAVRGISPRTLVSRIYSKRSMVY
jgi:hypothetical protein